MALTADRVTNVPVPFRQLRMKDAEGALQEGVVGAADLKVAQRGAGANMSVDIPVGACWVQIDTGTRNGLVHVYNDAVANVAFNASDATNPRIDQIGVQYNDTSIPAGTGGNTPTLRYLPGTATAGATLDTRTGAAALPNDCLRLADILVPAASTSVVTANIRDRRPWARGARFLEAFTGGDTTTTTSTPAMGSHRIECSGAPLRLCLNGRWEHSAATARSTFQWQQDGVAIGPAYVQSTVAATREASDGNLADYTFLPTAGSHVFQCIATVVDAGTLTLHRTAALPMTQIFREDVGQNAVND